MQTLSANRKVHRRPRQASRCTGSQVEQATPCPAGTVVNGFLNQRFLPLYQPAQALTGQSEMESVYMASLKHLTDHYGIDVPEVDSLAYPYNIIISHWYVSEKIRIKGRYREVLLERTDGQKIQLSVKETINTGSTLYYIPVEPLYKALQNIENISAKLLLGVCIYLHIKAGIFHYKDSESYLCYLYDIMDTWIEDDRDSMDVEDYTQQRTVLDETSSVGDKMAVMMADEDNLLGLHALTGRFTPRNRFETLCLKLAKDTLNLWALYPLANIYQHIVRSEADEEDDYYGNGKIGVNEYISFIGETSSCVYDSLMNMANDEFNERSGVQDFETVTVFDKPGGTYIDSLDYEQQVIAIIDQLCTLINEMP